MRFKYPVRRTHEQSSGTASGTLIIVYVSIHPSVTVQLYLLDEKRGNGPNPWTQ